MNRQISIISLTEAGLHLAKQLQQHLPEAKQVHKPKPFVQSVQAAFNAGDALIMICATGIVMRTLAPVLDNKLTDPPVLVLDELGHFVIPLLSGHEGGANDWAAYIAKAISAQLVITTANAYIRPSYAVGMGCERGCSEAHLKDLLMDALAQADLSLEKIHSINSIDIKADEDGLISLAKNLNLPFLCFDKNQLGAVEHLLSVKSEYVYNTVGVYGVAESAALVSAQKHTQSTSELVLNKIKTDKATCAIARSYARNDRLSE
ncbi:MAG: cobalamin biosynthesis protein CbiG [Alteromonadaceae bacterium]|nr:MAG: cobalamin biosynthesis protein CbiG [Alteromonadaceae bacterium]